MIRNMSRNMCRIIGILLMIVSVFLILGGLYLGEAGLPPYAAPVSLGAGIAMLIVGVIFYRILKNDE